MNLRLMKNWKITLALVLGGGMLALPAAAGTAAVDLENGASARELYNAGTQKLREGKLADAESYLKNAVASQDTRIQPPALYNLGSVRFKDGLYQLTNAPSQEDLLNKSQEATNSGNDALKALDDALANDDTRALVEAYLRGRGARRELKAAADALKRAMDLYGAVLTQWRRALGDFRSAKELQPEDKNAQFNADATDRYIAKLVDMLQPLSLMRQAMEAQRESLLKKMTKAKGKLPDLGQQKGGEDGDDDDDGNKKPKDLANGFEGPVRNGQRMELTFEEAKRLLNMLTADKKLSTGGFSGEQKPATPKGKDW